MAKLSKKWAQVSQQAMDRLDLPVNLASGVARMELLGNRSLYIDRHRVQHRGGGHQRRDGGGAGAGRGAGAGGDDR